MGEAIVVPKRKSLDIKALVLIGKQLNGKKFLIVR